MRRSSASSSGRLSLAPLRVKNEGPIPSGSGRLSTGSTRSSVGGRTSVGSAIGGGRNSVGSRKSMLPRYNQSSNSMATAAKKRRSSGYGRTYGEHGMVKDPRPNSDKVYKERSIKLLLEFLLEKGFPHNINKKVLLYPTSKDFFRIFEFLFSFIEPKYQVGPKPEEEIPKLFKLMGYPFPISKSNMFSIGSPHTWPTLLGALRFLMEIVKYAFNVDTDAVLFPPRDDEFDSIPESKILFNYMEEGYAAFLNGADTFEHLDEELARNLRQKTEGISGGLDQLVSENNILTRELTDLQNEPDRLVELREKHHTITADERKFQAYLENLEKHKHSFEKRIQEVDEEFNTMTAEYQAILANNKRMKAIFDSQEFSPADVERINMARQELQRQIESIEKDIEAIERQIWDEEINIGKIQQNTEAKCQEYNKKATMLKLIPPSAENAHGRDYEMRVNFHSGSIDFIGAIKPALVQMKKQCNEKVHEMEARRIGEMEGLDQVTEMVSDKGEEISKLESKHKRAEEELECKKEAMQRECQKLQAETDAIQAEITEMRRSSQMSVQEAQKELQQLHKRYEQENAAYLRDQGRYADSLFEAARLIVDHKETIQDYINLFYSGVEKSYADLLQTQYRPEFTKDD
ncbi:kinetochore protein NDC80 homolog [Lingula anatina]|uniref:Kinetochore protein NDC80 n=1 Tax=Lingula anatina TaxID=7574 RepID=A0A1S3JYT9_LINAN|nr:kinetochore protein NDC80 homolog [Lingula anatina]|eukprot:XP_013415462.1 kinetochore protein NDC80 homolog [Lingula anatina]